MSVYELFKSCRNGDKERVEYLLNEKDVDLNLRDKWDSTPLYYACLCGHEELVKYLLDNGALCKPNTFDGERCMYGALTNQIRCILKNNKVITSNTMRRDLYQEFLRRLFENEEYADITFNVQGETIAAHRSVLMSRSSFFCHKLESKWKDKTLIHVSHVLVTAWAFRKVLQYLYTGSLECHQNQLEEIILLARHCRLDKLLQDLDDTVKKKLSFESTKPGVNVTRICIEPNDVNCTIGRDLACLADAALPMAFCNIADVELPFSLGTKSSYSDVCFCVQNHSFQCHKALFCGRSDYFRALLMDHFGESTLLEEGRPVINIRDVSTEVFVQVLYYIYQDCCKLDEDNVYDVLLVADQYLLPGLKSQCGSILGHCLATDNVINVLRVSRLFNLPRLEDQCAGFIAQFIERMVDNEDFHRVVIEDAQTVEQREETDSIPIIDDIRYHITNILQMYSEMEEANKKLCLIDNMLEQLGLDA